VKVLLLSLGHGASAVYVEDGAVLSGYENERLTKIKSDSHYPEQAIEEINQYHVLFDVEHILISHWFIDGKLPRVPNKYYNPIHLARVCPKAQIHSVSMEFTHHDAHMFSAKLFAGYSYCNQQGLLGIVCDGFGTMGETLYVFFFL